VRATPVGIAWTNFAWDSDQVMHALTELPAGLVAAGVRPDDYTLVSDGVAYAWITDTGIGHWSPEAGVTHVRLAKPWWLDDHPMRVVGPYVVFDGPAHSGGQTTVVDSRSGGVVSLDDRVVATGADTMALQAGMLSVADLPELTC
jgi:hypothetical protein